MSVTYIALQNPQAAEQMGNRLLDIAFSLNTLPERGRMVPEFQRPELREVIFRSYRIIYRIQSSPACVEIVRFWHGTRGFPIIPQSLLH